MKRLSSVIAFLLLAIMGYLAVFVYLHASREKALLKIIDALKAESRTAEVLVTRSEEDLTSRELVTTIKFLEYTPLGKPLPPRYFTFHGNILQFQALVVRFEDLFVERRDRLRGKSAYLFLKAFALNGTKAEVFEITPAGSTPEGYRVDGLPLRFQNEIWRRFWHYALDPSARKQLGIKNAQIEAPGTRFIAGQIYTIVIEHDGGLRIDTKPVPAILKGETIQP